MPKVLLISGSNRKGNTEYILTKLNEVIDDSALILLSNRNIDNCKGCLYCQNNDSCIINDDINSIIDILLQSEMIIFGVPNYFDNVSGLFKNFMDRLHPLYKSKLLENKKVIFIYVGGGEELGTKEELHKATNGFVKYLGLNLLEEFSFKALNAGDVKEQDDKIKDMVDKINNYI